MKMSTVALIISHEAGVTSLLDTLSDPEEIEFMNLSIRAGDHNPLEHLYELRARKVKQENDFGDHLEELLSQPFLNPEIQSHGIRWLKSQIRIETYHKTERDAVKIISEYAYKIYQEDPDKTDFFLASTNSQVRIRVFTVAPPGHKASRPKAG